MSNKLKCAKCLNPLLDEGIKCGLFCGKSFHRLCTGVSDVIFNEIGKINSNFSYHCSDCAKFPVRELFTKVNDLVSVVDVLTKKMCEFDSLQLKLSELLNNKLVSNESEFCNNTSDEHDSPLPSAFPSLKNNDGSEITNVNNNVNGLTKNGKKNVSINSSSRAVTVGVDNLPDDICVIPPVKWLHVSKFSVSTSEQTIKNYVSNKLNIPFDEVQCYKLIKKDSDITNLKFINFKVGIPANKENDATNVNNWPVNVYVKSFKFFPKNKNPITTTI